MLSADNCRLKLLRAHRDGSGLSEEGLFGLRQTIDPAQVTGETLDQVFETPGACAAAVNAFKEA